MTTKTTKPSKYDENGDPIPKYQDGNVPDYEDIPLSRAIDINGTKVATLRMRQPLVSDQRLMSKMQGDDAEREIKLMSNLCEVTPDDIQKLSMRDYKKVQGQYYDFLG